MGQKSMNENIKKTSGKNTVQLANDVLELDDLLDDEGWDLLNSLTEEELSQLNSDFDPENSLVPVAERQGMVAAKNAGPMFNQEDLVQGLNKMVENSKTVYKNEKIRQKDEKRKKDKEEKLKKQYSRDKPELKREPTVELTAEEEALLEEATEEELIEAAALLKMNGILTNDQIQSVWAGEKPKGSLTSNSHVKAAEIKMEKRVAPKDEETELDVVELMKNIKEDSDAMFYLCINNQPKLEKKVKTSIIEAVKNSKKMKHLSLAMIGLIDFEVKQLAEAIRFNEKLETINLESNVITQHGLAPLMKEIAHHPNIREVKIANQKQPFGGNGEECMATAIDQNENILKFGYSFKQPGPRNKADGAIIRHNEALRQKRRNGEDVYDLKAVCKIRDPWPQPWIKVKNRRGLGGLIETKAELMGSKIDVETDTRRESRGPNLRNAIAKPLNINDLLAQRKTKLKGTKVEELEQERERKQKELFKQMNEQEKGKKDADEMQTNENKSNDDGGSVLSKLAGKYLEDENTEETPPAAETKKETKKSVNITSLDDSNGTSIRRRKQGDDEEEGGINFGEFESKEETKAEKDTPKIENKKKTLGGTSVKIASLNDDNNNKGLRRRRKKSEEKDEGGLDFSSFETKEEPENEEEPQEEPSEVREPPKREEKSAAKPTDAKIISLDNNDSKITRRRKKVNDDEECGVDFGAFEEKKDEEVQKEKEKEIKPTVKIASLQQEDTGISRRRRKKFDGDNEESTGIDFGAFEEKKEEIKNEQEKPKEEPKSPKKEELRPVETEQKPLKKEEPKKAPVKIASLQQQDTSVTRRRRKKFDEEVEGGLDFGAFEEKKEEKTPDPEPEPELKPPMEEPKVVEKKEEPKKKDLRSQLSKGIKIASLDQQEEKRPLRRRKERMFEEEEEKPDPKEEKVKEEEKKEEKKGPVIKLEEVDEIGRTRRRSKKSNEEEEKYDPFEGVSKSIAKLDTPAQVTRRRRRKFDEDEEESGVDMIARAAEEARKEEERVRKEKEAKEEEERKKKLEEQRSKLADVEGRKKKLSLEGGRKIVAKLDKEEQVPRRRKKRYEWEDEDEIPAPSKDAESEKKNESDEEESSEDEKQKKKEAEEERKRKESEKRKIAELPNPETNSRRRKTTLEKEQEDKVDPFAEIEKTEINAVRNAVKNLKELPPPDTSVRRRRRQKNDEDSYDPFASVEQKPKEETKSPEPEKPKSPEPVVEDAATRRARRQREREEKAKQQEDQEEAERKARRERRAKEREEKERKEKEEEEKKNAEKAASEKKLEKGQWFTDEETKSGDRRFGGKKEEEPAVDLFGGRDDDDGEPKKLSLRGRMARRGR